MIRLRGLRKQKGKEKVLYAISGIVSIICIVSLILTISTHGFEDV